MWKCWCLPVVIITSTCLMVAWPSKHDQLASRALQEVPTLEGAPPQTCKPASTSTTDPGYVDSFRGWYDVQQCGRCHDYCRWVGNSGSGGDPSHRLQYYESWWSCRLAGGTSPYTPRDTYTSWPFKKCSDGAGAVNATPCKKIAVAPDGLVAHYPMEGNCNDVMGNFDAEIVGNVQFSTDFGTKNQGAFVRNSYYGSGCIASGFKNYVWGNQLSVCVYAKRTADMHAHMGIITTGIYDRGSWEIRVGREGCVTGTCQNLGGGVVTEDNPATWQVHDVRMTMGAWHHICMTYDGATYNFYMDGILARTSTQSSGDILNTDKPLFIGQAEMQLEGFEGYIDNVRIYKRALPASDIAKLAASDNLDVLATHGGDHKNIICPFLSSMIHGGFLPRKAEYTKEELEILTLDAGLDPALTRDHIDGNFKDIPTGRIDVFNMEGLPNEHHTSTGINDCNTFFSNCAVRAGPHWRGNNSKYKVCESKTVPCLLPSQLHFDLFVLKVDADKDGVITYKELEDADSKENDEFFVNDFNEIGSGTISGAFSFLLDIARDQACGMSTGLMQRINMDRMMPPNFDFPVRGPKLRPDHCNERRLVEDELGNSFFV